MVMVHLGEMVIILDGEFFRELRKLSYSDEMRNRQLMIGIKRILENKKSESFFWRKFQEFLGEIKK